LKKKFEYERNYKEKNRVCLVHGSIGNKVSYWQFYGLVKSVGYLRVNISPKNRLG